MNSTEFKMRGQQFSLCLLLWLSFAGSAFAGEDSSESKAKRHSESETSGKSVKKLSGRCGVMENVANPLSGACTSAVLVFTDSHGEKIGKTRTLNDGTFEFILDKDSKGPYRIQPGSRYFDLLAPTEPVLENTEIMVWLRQNEKK